MIFGYTQRNRKVLFYGFSSTKSRVHKKLGMPINKRIGKLLPERGLACASDVRFVILCPFCTGWFFQVVMMVGLPSAGKTVLAQNHCRENVDKHFLVLGRDLISDRMKVRV